MPLLRTILAICVLRVAHAFTSSSSSNVFWFKCNVSPSISDSSTPSWPLALSQDTDGRSEIPTGITLKIALDAQGGAADLSSEKSERFTCGESLDMVHRLRRVSDAVLVGRSTVQIDDCTLTVRRVPLVPEGEESDDVTPPRKQQPFRVIIDPKLDLKLDQFKIFQDGLATIVIHALANGVNCDESNTDSHFVKHTNNDFPDVTYLGLRPIVDDEGKSRLSTLQIRDILATEFSIHHIMVEGGPNTALQFLRDKAVDRAILVYAPMSFKEPLLSNISTSVLKEAGLERIGDYASGIDSIKCYSRPELPWPSTSVSSWP